MYHLRGDMGKYWEKAIRGDWQTAAPLIVMRRFHNLLSIIILIGFFVNDRDGKIFAGYSSQTTLSILMSCGSVGRASTIWQENARAIFFAPLARLSVQS